MSELKACPCCGRAASSDGVVNYGNTTISARWNDGKPVSGTLAFFCNCPRCGLNNKGVVGYRTKEDAIKAWNTRADGWISVEAELSDIGQRVLVMMAGVVDITVYMLGSNIRWDYVTNWQPLPSKPEAPK